MVMFVVDKRISEHLVNKAILDVSMTKISQSVDLIKTYLRDEKLKEIELSLNCVKDLDRFGLDLIDVSHIKDIGIL